MNRTRTFTSVAIAVGTSLAIAACGTAAPIAPPALAPGATVAPPATAARPATTINLRLGTADDAGRPGAEQIRKFAASVKHLSGGTLVIQPVWDPMGDDARGGWDQGIARMVVAGELDMGNIPARAWDTEGVTTLRALDAPFLVTSDALAAEIATGRIADQLLNGLKATGVTGLALLPESLRHLFVAGAVPDEIGDFAGMVFRVPRSDTTWALFEALGATADDFTDPGESDDAAWSSGELHGAESSFALAHTLGVPLTGIGDVPLFVKMNSLVINSAVFARLTTEQRTILREAAAMTVAFAIDAMPDTVAYAGEFCRKGGAIALAGDALIAELDRAVEPVYSALAADERTRSAIGGIRALGAEISARPPMVAPCARTG